MTRALKRLLEKLRNTLDDGVSNVELISGELETKKEDIERLESECESVLGQLQENSQALGDIDRLLEELQLVINTADDLGISI